MKSSKEDILADLKHRVGQAQEKIKEGIERVKTLISSPISGKKEDREHGLYLRRKTGARLEQLVNLERSPFFAKCVVEQDSIDVRYRGSKPVYFGKYEYSEAGIYSWTAPIATIRFEQPGKTSFRLPNGQIKNVTIREKEQYMIVDGKVLFFARETDDEPRQLIYQENFSVKKGAFVLPEIVEVMEKAQDAVIRAHHIGPFAISGPAGSGKTTLALHRVAYLAQAPETAELYPADAILVFVQDAGTKSYFSHLLPELGIHNVKITTFYEWALEILQAEGIGYSSAINSEFEKLELLKRLRNGDPGVTLPKWNKNPWTLLGGFYGQSDSRELAESFKKQKPTLTLDKIDLTVALMALKEYLGQLEIHTYSNRALRGGGIVTKKEKKVLSYALLVVDEFQNYLPEQIRLLRSSLDEKTGSIVYVGDMAQQIQHGTIRQWEEAGESIDADRQVRLQKVYRNTKHILKYIESLGYAVSIPESLKEGVEVSEFVHDDREEMHRETVSQIRKIIENKKEVSIGVLGPKKEDVVRLQEEFAEEISSGKIHISTIFESQGVEFDIVLIVGIHSGMFDLKNAERYTDEYRNEHRKIQKDLLYIALTRAMGEMYIYGTVKLEEACNELSF